MKQVFLLLTLSVRGKLGCFSLTLVPVPSSLLLPLGYRTAMAVGAPPSACKELTFEGRDNICHRAIPVSACLPNVSHRDS